MLAFYFFIPSKSKQTEMYLIQYPISMQCVDKYGWKIRF